VPQRVLLASTLLSKAAAMPLAEPLAFAALPPLALHAVKSRLPAGTAASGSRCVDDCLTLAYAYAELGIEAQVRVATLTVTDITTHAEAAYGDPRPRWDDGGFSGHTGFTGHTVVWLPERRYLIDPAAERFPEIAAYQAGPVIAQAPPETDPASPETDTASPETDTASPETDTASPEPAGTDPDAVTLTVARGYLRIGYALSGQAASAGILDAPGAQASRNASGRAGINVASELVWLLASQRTADDTAVIPYPRAAALIDAARNLDRYGSLGEDFFFAERGSSGEAAPGPEQGRPVRLHQIPLPAGTPAPVAVS
jgi:hypothetical protein